MPFFDFHLHPTLKSLFSDPPQKLSPWDKLDTRMIPGILRLCTDFPYILQSQANLNQLWNNECHLVCIALYAPEKNLIGSDLILKQADGPMKAYLNKNKLTDIVRGKIKPYDLIVNDDLVTLMHPENFGVLNKKIVPLRRASDYDPNSKDSIYVVFSVEGCHTLSKTGSLASISTADVIANLDDLRSKFPVIAINLTHMEQSPLCNQAYGMQFINNDAFKPTGRGLSADGAAIVQHCYQNNVMVDVKHMSLMARQQLYSLRKSPAFQQINQPLICTHAGFAGISTKDIPDYIYYKRSFTSKGYVLLYMGKQWLECSVPRPSFNTSSINLYDEDIIEILKSDGMIGLSMDKRILGFADPDAADVGGQHAYPLEVEYISQKEQNLFLSKPDTGRAFENESCIENSEVKEAGAVNPRLGEYHLKHFMAHIIHLIKVSHKAGLDIANTLKQVCIGSDFDGVINPIWICDTTDELVYFKEQFERSFSDFATDCHVPLPAGFDVLKFSNQLFYENGKEFLFKRLRP
ncbi:MAG TPA: membrane dipeptidase [Cyclobacteriaceae bacterium]|jgi:microsomal dipeptidase-like Zn-dependent dipeptidase|nr:membrane dipeptidase [Cyclobacteriaceae bacterium]